MVEEIEEFDSNIFISKEASDKFKKLESRRCVEDRGIEKNIVTMGFLRMLVVGHEWGNFIDPSFYIDVPTTLIQEFYANLSVIGDWNIRTMPSRGEEVLFNACRINNLLRTPRRAQCFYQHVVRHKTVPIEQII